MNKQFLSFPFSVPVMVLFLLMAGNGGRWEPADHISKALVGFTFFLFLGKTIINRPLFKAVYGFCGILTVSAILSSAPLAAWSVVSGVWCWVFLATMGMVYWTNDHRQWLSRFIAGIVGVQIVLQSLNRFFSFPIVNFFPGNPQYFSFWCCAVFFISLGQVFVSIKGLSRPFHLGFLGWVATSGLALGGIVMTPVRSGWVGLGVGSLVFLVGWFGRRGLLGWLGLFSLLFVTLPDHRLEKLLKLDQVASYKRVDIWQTSLSAVADRPLLGWGPGQFENAYWIHERPQEGPVRFEMTTDRAHSEWLQVFVDGGVPAGLLTLFAFGLLWRSFPRGTQSIGLKSSLAGLAAFSLVNSPMALPLCGLLVGVVVGLTPTKAVPALHASSYQKRWTLPLKVMAPLFFVGEVVLFINSLMGENRSIFLDATRLSRVETMRDRLDREIHSSSASLQRVENDLQKLLRWNPQRAELWRDMGHFKSEHQNPPDLSGALACYAKALLLRPHHAPWWMEKARLLAGTGNFKAAVEAGDRAISLEPWYFDADLNLGYYYFKLGQIEEARKRIGTLSAMYTNWPVASLNDSGYRKTVLHKDEEALRRALAILQ